MMQYKLGQENVWIVLFNTFDKMNIFYQASGYLANHFNLDKQLFIIGATMVNNFE